MEQENQPWREPCWVFSSFGKVSSVKDLVIASTGGLHGVSNPLLIPFSPHRWGGIILVFIPFYLQAKKQRISKNWKCLETCQCVITADRQVASAGGDSNLVLIARCLVQEADAISLDEPFGGIDSVSVIMQTLKTLKKKSQDHPDVIATSAGPSLLWPSLLLHRPSWCIWEAGSLYQRKSACSLWAWRLFIGWRRMITEFIDGLQQFRFLQNALITAIAIGIVAGNELDASLF